MSIAKSLYQGDLVTLAPVDAQNDAELISKWTHHTEIMRQWDIDPLQPLSAWKVTKMLEKMEKEAEEKRNLYYFSIRTLDEKRMVGLVQIDWIEWVHGTGRVKLLIGEAQDQSKGYGEETLRMILNYAFSELNLYRLSTLIPDYDQATWEMFNKAGFCEEVRQRQAINRFGQRWDLILMGLLKVEWQASLQPA
ncbi:MAG: GNAT family N-acetyltransferase [Anaerolineales bacterium]|nr:GNAT family N-acetyltransferase [Anaerolineales bacterium]